jgi:hypothetical protein
MSPAHTAQAPVSSNQPRRCGASLAGVAGIVMIALVLESRPAGAQSLGRVLRDLARQSRADTAARRTGDASTAGPDGGSVVVVERRLDGPSATVVDTGTVALDALPDCEARRCPGGYDLVVRAVRLPGPELPAGAPVVVATEIANRGARPAPAAELVLCRARPDRSTCAGDADAGDAGANGAGVTRALLRVPVAPLAPGRRVLVRAAVPLTPPGRETADVAVTAEVGPVAGRGRVQPATGLRENEDDNAATSDPARVVLPALQWAAADVPASARAGAPLPVTLRLRNASAAASAPTDVQLSGVYFCSATRAVNWGGGRHRVAVPALAPGQTLTLRLRLPEASQCPAIRRGAQLTAAVDVDRRQAWGPAHERAVERRYELR